MALSPGTRLGQYEILSPLGAGGMGEVYKARDTRLGREVAVKVLPHDLSSDRDRLARFEHEARSASALNHPNIVTILEVGRGDSTSFIAMELVEGKTLRELVSAGPLPARRLLPLGAQIADGLAKAHAAGIVHRDLKPENLMVNKDGFAKILDFGLAKLVAPLSEAGSELPTMARGDTRPGMILGTVGYMSPEQAGGRPVDFRSDQFGLGAILYEMATGRRAFQRDTAVDTLSAILHQEPEPMRSLNARAPESLRWIVERCLAKDPEERYASTRDLARDLQQAHAHLSETSGEAAPLLRLRRRRRPAWAAAAVIAALLLADVGLRLRPREVAAPRSSPTLTKATFATGLQNEPAWSPDGKFLAYTTDERGNLDIVVQPRGGGAPIRVADSDADDAQPAWSPDGSKIAFVSARDRSGHFAFALGQGVLTDYVTGRGGDIFLVAALGGTASKLAESGYYPAWSPDGKRIVFGSNRDGPWDLWTIPAEGGAATRLTKDSAFDYQPSWSPDGKWIAYGSGGPSTYNVRVVPALGGPPRTVTEGTSWVAHPVWSADGGSILYSAEKDGIVNLWRVAFDPAGGKPAAPERLTIGGGADLDAAVSRDGKIAFSTVRINADVWEMDIGSGRLRQVTFETTQEDFPSASPDGRTLLVESDRTGASSIWTIDLQGRFLEQYSQGTLGHWSHDGKMVVYLRDGTVRLQAAGSIVSTDTGVKAGFVDFSPDDSKLVFSRGPEGGTTEGTTEIGVYSIAAGTTHRLLSFPGDADHPAWSRDGRWIVFQSTSTSSRQLLMMSSEGGDPKPLTDGRAEDSHPSWSPRNPDEVLFLRDHRRICVLSVSTGKVRELGGGPPGTTFLDYSAWSADASKAYFSVHRKAGDIYVMEGR